MRESKTFYNLLTLQGHSALSLTCNKTQELTCTLLIVMSPPTTTTTNQLTRGGGGSGGADGSVAGGCSNI